MNAFTALQACGGYITNSHVVYASGRHGTTFVNTDAIYPRHEIVCQLCRLMAAQLMLRRGTVRAVVAPEKGGIALSQWVAHHLHEVASTDVLALYAEKEGSRFVLRRGYDELVRGLQVAVVDDVITTGGSVIRLIDALSALDCRVSVVGALFNRGGITNEMLGVPRLVSLETMALDSYAEDDCPLCRADVPVNVTVGMGREFLARRASPS